MTTIHFTAQNELAHAHVRNCISAIDQRLSIDTYDLIVAVADAMAQHLKPSVKILGQAKATDALVAGGVLGRVSDRSQFFVKDEFRPDYECKWATLDSDADTDERCHVRSKSGTEYRTRASALTLDKDEVASLGNFKCYFAKILDLEATCAAFDSGSAPSIRFTSCQHVPDPVSAEKFLVRLREACAVTGTRMAEIQGGWMVITDTQRFLTTLNNATIRQWNNPNKRFALITQSDYGREVTSYGCYGGAL